MLLTLRIVHLNDSHSMLDRAGQVKTVIDTARQVDPGCLFLVAGDALVGTPWYDVGGKGALDFQVLEAMQPDAYVIGNHDLDGGIHNFLCVLQTLQIPLTVANWQIQGPLAELVNPYVIKTVQGKKVAIIGLSIDPCAYGLPLDAGIAYRVPAMALQDLLPMLKKIEKPDAIIVLSHLGASTDEELAGYFPEVAAFVGGHSHTAIPFPERYTHPNHSVTVVVQAGCKNEYVGLLEVDIIGGKVVNGTRGGLIRITEDIPADPEITAMLSPYQQAMAPYDAVIGKAAENIPLWVEDSPDKPMGNLVAGWIREVTSQMLGQSIDLAILNQTGFRRGLAEGAITKRDVYEAYPFDNGLMVTTLRGIQVQAMLDHLATRGGDPISGITLTLAGDHATDVRIGGQPLLLDKAYRVASNSYLIKSGGSGYTVLSQGADTVDTQWTIRGVIEAAVAATPVIEKPKDAQARIQQPAFQLAEEISMRWGIGDVQPLQATCPCGRP